MGALGGGFSGAERTGGPCVGTSPDATNGSRLDMHGTPSSALIASWKDEQGHRGTHACVQGPTFLPDMMSTRPPWLPGACFGQRDPRLHGPGRKRKVDKPMSRFCVSHGRISLR